ncbi:MAG: hypothetical protein ACREMY_09590 [bacterium]
MTHNADYVRHEERKDTPRGDTKIICECGERCASYMEFYRHRGDEYKRQIDGTGASDE